MRRESVVDGTAKMNKLFDRYLARGAKSLSPAKQSPLPFSLVPARYCSLAESPSGAFSPTMVLYFITNTSPIQS